MSTVSVVGIAGVHADSMVIIGTPPLKYIPPVPWVAPYMGGPYLPYLASKDSIAHVQD